LNLSVQAVERRVCELRFVTIGLAIASTTSLTASAVLIGAGASKVQRPVALARVLYAIDLPSSLTMVRLVGIAEVAVGAAAGVCLAVGESASERASIAALGLAYAGFAAFIGYALVGPKRFASCGCAGSKDVPPSWLHFIANAAVVGAALVLVVEPVRLVRSDGQPGAFVVALAAAALAAYLSYLSLLRSSGARAFAP
jgi:hypothetical protein